MSLEVLFITIVLECVLFSAWPRDQVSAEDEETGPAHPGSRAQT